MKRIFLTCSDCYARFELQCVWYLAELPDAVERIAYEMLIAAAVACGWLIVGTGLEPDARHVCSRCK